MFTQISMSDDNEICCKDENFLKHLGTSWLFTKLSIECLALRFLFFEVRLEFRRVQYLGSVMGSSTVYRESQPRTYHEQSKKAQLGSNVTFGAAKAVSSLGPANVHWIDSSHGPAWREFVFTYRKGGVLDFVLVYCL